MKTQKNKKFRRGQGMTEYIIIVALIAIAAIGVVTLFGNNIRQLFGGAADALAGDMNVKNTGTKANDAIKNKDMATFGQNNKSISAGGGGGGP